MIVILWYLYVKFAALLPCNMMLVMGCIEMGVVLFSILSVAGLNMMVSDPFRKYF